MDIYGKVRTFAGRSLKDCPFRFQGQYEDSETGLYYNRFRYYDPDSGNYISQDPIGLAGNNPTLYGYVKDPNSWIDVFGLDCDTKKLRQHAADTQKHINSLPNQNMTQKQDVTRADGKWWDLTTQKDWENHQKRYGGGCTGLFWD